MIASEPLESQEYELVVLASGARSVRCVQVGEVFHPAVGPVAEAQALYVRQMDLPRRIQGKPEGFEVWDVGLGAAANVLTLLREIQGMDCRLRILSFDSTLAPLQFARKQCAELGYLEGFEDAVDRLLHVGFCVIENAGTRIEWRVMLGDFPTWIANSSELNGAPNSTRFEGPEAVLFDPFSLAKNPLMWTPEVFAGIRKQVNPMKLCSVATFSRSTMARTAMLLGGWFVGRGHPTGMKEETTIASSHLADLAEPLEARWLERALRSGSAEPTGSVVYQQRALSPESRRRLLSHPQFQRIS